MLVSPYAARLFPSGGRSVTFNPGVMLAQLTAPIASITL